MIHIKCVRYTLIYNNIFLNACTFMSLHTYIQILWQYWENKTKNNVLFLRPSIYNARRPQRRRLIDLIRKGARVRRRKRQGFLSSFFAHFKCEMSQPMLKWHLIRNRSISFLIRQHFDENVTLFYLLLLPPPQRLMILTAVGAFMSQHPSFSHPPPECRAVADNDDGDADDWLEWL